ncbi:MAG: hypothetical protein Edafosvirus24_4 [Edafosvirus sp.]|uniref:Uncharacterized protein n=1 Tax=Edafosvirus sp. TaxID=2487765 RepID=A0A3G4ZUU6_9VIRU|nr:MAG: hypothetical protein Edafosvirus24_4 [Edafosvirus sp.]
MASSPLTKTVHIEIKKPDSKTTHEGLQEQIVNLNDEFKHSPILTYKSIGIVCDVITKLSSGKLNYYWRTKLENELMTFISKALRHNPELWSKLIMRSPDAIVYSAMNQPGHDMKIPNFMFLEIAYKKGERFHSPLLVAQQKIIQMHVQLSCPISTSFDSPVFNPACRKKQFPENAIMISKIMDLIKESCNAGNPNALKLYIRYLQHDLNDRVEARKQIGKLFELGEIGDAIPQSNHLFHNFENDKLLTISNAIAILNDAVNIYTSVEQKFVDGVIHRENLIIQDGVSSVKVYEHHRINLNGTLTFLMARFGEQVIPFLTMHSDKKNVVGLIADCLVNHSKATLKTAFVLP